jgi:hypothetical protein
VEPFSRPLDKDSSCPFTYDRQPASQPIKTLDLFDPTTYKIQRKYSRNYLTVYQNLNFTE